MNTSHSELPESVMNVTVYTIMNTNDRIYVLSVVALKFDATQLKC
jgi:hypothetical protein